MNTVKTQLGILPLSAIAISTTNPRKTFDEAALAELAQSIKEHGVLQPILVRTIAADPEGRIHELVCGERRYRAATAAGLAEIPVSIRELTDDEAFELQIIENLERKDVHPLDEAEAFKRMLDSGRYTIADIAAKVAKPETFVAQRLKLVDLIDPIKQDFFHGHIGVAQAVMLARSSADVQKEIHKNAKPWQKGDAPRYGSANELRKSILNNYGDLATAHFKLDDHDIETIRCHTCVTI